MGEKPLKGKEELYELLNAIFLDDSNILIIVNALESSLVNSGKLLTSELSGIINQKVPLKNVHVGILVMIYQELQKINGSNLPPITDYFSKEDISAADLYLEKKYNSMYPLKFKVLDTLSDNNQFLISLSIQELKILKDNGIIQWDANIQRESVAIKKGNNLVTRIKYDDKRAREIGSSIASNNYYSNSLRWHLIENENANWEIKDDNLIIHSGTIAEIDGQHRDKGSEYALIENPNVFLKFPILFTIGTVRMGKDIIIQEEKRAPFDREYVKSMEKTNGHRAVNIIKNSEELDTVYKFYNTTEQYKNGVGFISESSFAEQINQCYEEDMTSQRQIKKVSEWIIEVLNYIAEIYRDDFKAFPNTTRWTVSRQVIVGYVYLSKVIKDNPEWERLAYETLLKVEQKLINNGYNKLYSNESLKVKLLSIFKEVIW